MLTKDEIDEFMAEADRDGNGKLLFCKSCYGKHFGPKGYGFGGGGAGMMASESKPVPADRTPEFGCQAATAAPTAPPENKPVAPQTAPKSRSFKENFKSGNDRCPRCNDRVYYAEKVVANGINWHKRCLRCATCGKSLDSTNLNEHEEEIYCKACYGKSFGPKGFGYGISASALQMT